MLSNPNVSYEARDLNKCIVVAEWHSGTAQSAEGLLSKDFVLCALKFVDFNRSRDVILIVGAYDNDILANDRAKRAAEALKSIFDDDLNHIEIYAQLASVGL